METQTSIHRGGYTDLKRLMFGVGNLFTTFRHTLETDATVALPSPVVRSCVNPPEIHAWRRADSTLVELQLEQAKRLQATTLNAIDSPIATIDPFSFIIVDANKAFHSKYPSRVVGQKCYELTHKRQTPCDDEHCRCPISETLRTGKATVVEHHHQAANGGTRYLQLTAYPVLDQYGKITQIVHVEQDISAQRQLEQQLVDARRAAEHANEAKSKFLARMSHELRTPMNVVIGMTNLAGEMAKDPVQQKYLQMVKTSAEILLAIINDILDLSKIEAGQLKVTDEPLALGATIEETIRLLSHQARQKGLQLCCDLDISKDAMVHGDALRIRQVFTNLINNAIKFTESGSILVSSRLIADNPQTASVEFTVKDTGIGISPAGQKAVFSAFHQEDTPYDRRKEGTGLGLTIVKKLVELMGGTIRLESTQGSGTAFHLRFLFRKADKRSLLREKPAGVLESQALQCLKALVVSKELNEHGIVASLLSRWGITPILAADVQDACDKLRLATMEHHPFNLIIDDHPHISPADIRASSLATTHASVPIVRIGDQPDGCPPEGSEIFFCPGSPLVIAELAEIIGALVQGQRPIQVIPDLRKARPAPPASNTPRNVLLCEDNTFNAMLAQAVLNKLGHSVTTAVNGLEAIKFLCRSKFDIVLMDIQMPVMDGITAAGYIRACEAGRPFGAAAPYPELTEQLLASVRGSYTPIVAMTAHAMIQDREACQQAGMDGYIVKPFQTEDLVKIFTDLLDTPEETSAKTCHASSEEVPVAGDVSPADAGYEMAREYMITHFNLSREDTVNLLTTMQHVLNTNLTIIQTALERQDLQQLQRTAHTIKGSLAQIGLTEMASLSRFIEEMARQGGSTSESYNTVVQQLISGLQPFIHFHEPAAQGC